MRQVRTLGLLGTGVIGGGWAARALHFGIDVLAADVKPEMEEWMRGAVANAEGALARLTFAPLPPKGKLSFTTDLAAMARAGGLHPGEHPRTARAQAKRCWRQVSREAPADVVIASSTSGLMPSDLQRDMRAPGAFPGRSSVQSGVPAAAGGAGRRPRTPRRRRSRRPAASTPTSACMRSRCGARCPGISPTGCRRRCGARSCTW